MEERCASEGDKNTEPSSLYLPLPLPPGKTETYIVQIQRDQIYRVPPPEHAVIVESHRKGIPQSNKKNYSILAIVIAFLLVAAIVIGGISFFILSYNNPKSPHFYIAQIHANNLQSSSHGRANQPMNPQFPISILYKNPNTKMNVKYGVGTMTLMFKGQKIAKGKSPSFDQEAEDDFSVEETLNGIKGEMPISLQKNLSDEKPKSITLIIDMPLEVTNWVKKIKTKLHVTCDLKVDALGEGTKILSQKCRNNF